MLRFAAGCSGTSTEAVLLAALGSAVSAATEAVFASVPVAAGSTSPARRTLRDSPGWRSPSTHVTPPAPRLQPDGRAAAVIAAGRASVSRTPRAVAGPAFVAVSV